MSDTASRGRSVPLATAHGDPPPGGLATLCTPATFVAKGIARGAACEPVRGAAGVDRDGGDAG